jgi:hypothetical protein
MSFTATFYLENGGSIRDRLSAGNPADAKIEALAKWGQPNRLKTDGPVVRTSDNVVICEAGKLPPDICLTRA